MGSQNAVDTSQWSQWAPKIKLYCIQLPCQAIGTLEIQKAGRLETSKVQVNPKSKNSCIENSFSKVWAKNLKRNRSSLVRYRGRYEAKFNKGQI